MRDFSSYLGWVECDNVVFGMCSDCLCAVEGDKQHDLCRHGMRCLGCILMMHECGRLVKNEELYYLCKSMEFVVLIASL